MKHTILRSAALSFAAITLTAAASCGKIKNEDISDSKQQNDNDAGVVRIACFDTYAGNSTLAKIRSSFTRQTSYQTEIINYYQYTNYNTGSMPDYSETFNQLQMDILAGNSPDIISLPASYAASLNKSGYLADLYSVMDSCDAVKREDFLPNLLEGYEIDGRLPVICTEFGIDTAIALSSTLGSEYENWTLEQAMDVYDSLPDGTDFLFRSFDNEAKLNNRSFFLSGVSRDACDYDNRTCDFSSDFKTALDFAVSHPNCDIGCTDNEWEYDASFGLGKAVVYPVFLSGFNVIASEALYATPQTQDFTFVGYPSETGCGALINPYETFAVTETSNCKDAAWQLISMMYDIDYKSEPFHAFSPLRDKLTEASEEHDKYNNFAMRQPLQRLYTQYLGPYLNSDEYDGGDVVISDETVQKLLDYIYTLKFEPYRDYMVESIINEECDEVFGGGKSVQDCADMLDNRITIYMSEKN